MRFTEIMKGTSNTLYLTIRLVEEGLLTGLTTNDISDIDINKLVDKIDNLLRDINDKTLMAFGQYIVLENTPKQIEAEYGIDKVCQRARTIKVKLQSRYWRTQDISGVSLPDSTPVYKLWMEPDLREWVIEERYMYLSIHQMKNLLAIERMYRNHGKGSLRGNPKRLEEIIPFKVSVYPWNIITDIFDMDQFLEMQPDVLTANTRDLEKVIFDHIDPSMHDIFIKRYKEEKTFREIGDEYNLTDDRIIQKIHKSLRDFRRIRNHMGGYMKLRSIIMASSMNQSMRVWSALYDGGYVHSITSMSINAIDYLVKLMQWKYGSTPDGEIVKEIIDNNTYLHMVNEGVIKYVQALEKHEALERMRATYSPEMPIVQLDLSVRSYNCLARAGCKTVRDILDLEKDEFLHLRNLGVRSAKEVVSKLQELGFDASHLCPEE